MFKRIVKKYIFLLFQALSAVLVSACICIYSFFAKAYVNTPDGIETRSISLGDFKDDYYDSEVYNTNLTFSIDELVQYAVIKEQLETNGKYDPDKVIYIGEYSHRFDEEPYEGPEAGYYLKDLISWGQFGISTSGISHSYKVFDSWDELNAFFGAEKNASKDSKQSSQNLDPVIEDQAGDNSETSLNVYYYGDNETAEISITDEATGLITITEDSSDNTIPMLDVISNRYLSSEEKKLEDYAADAAEYAKLVENLEETALSLYTNFRLYSEFEDKFNTDNSNIRFYIINNKQIYSNLLNYKRMDLDTLSDTFKNFGEYIYIYPRSLEYSTNTSIDYDTVNEAIMEYSYFYGDNTRIWVGIDTTYPADDIYRINYMNLKNSLRNAPWVISFAAIGLIGFISFMVFICISGKKRLDADGSNRELKFLDKLPVEIESIATVLTCMIIYLFTLFLTGGNTVGPDVKIKQVLIPVMISTFLYSVTGLLFLYSILRRAYLQVLFKTSITVSFFRLLGRRSSFLRKWFFRIYDYSGTAIRTWASYIFFLIFNTFWACMLFFSSIPIISFLVLLLFDAMVGMYLFNSNYERKKISDTLDTINSGNFDAKLDTRRMHGDNKDFAEKVNQVGNGIKIAVEKSSKDEKLKADLITNVSHDIKTPLTSIINYVDLIKRENIDNERVKNYVKILDEKSQRLKQLTVDLVEASKITSGNITLELTKINVVELIYQAKGEFEEKYEEKGLTLITTFPKSSAIIEADPKYIWRIVENLFQNVYKYAMPDTRVYLDVTTDEEAHILSLSLKNISNQQLNINADELTERFIRGDVSRNTEGSGLGLSIVKSLVKAHNGTFDIYLDGDLFKATVTLPIVNKQNE